MVTSTLQYFCPNYHQHSITKVRILISEVYNLGGVHQFEWYLKPRWTT